MHHNCWNSLKLHVDTDSFSGICILIQTQMKILKRWQIAHLMCIGHTNANNLATASNRTKKIGLTLASYYYLACISSSIRSQAIFVLK
jgi:hypothetical protein